MPEPTFNDNDPTPGGGAALLNAQGHAAVLLVESLIHALIARSVITVEDAIEIVGAATAVTVETMNEMNETPAALLQSLTLLTDMSVSLSIDLPPTTSADA